MWQATTPPRVLEGRQAAATAETGPRGARHHCPDVRRGTELRGGGPRGRRPPGTPHPRCYLHSGLPQPVSGLCPSERGAIIQLPPAASGPLSAEKFSLRLGPLALCHLWAEDTGEPRLHAGEGAARLRDTPAERRNVAETSGSGRRPAARGV